MFSRSSCSVIWLLWSHRKQYESYILHSTQLLFNILSPNNVAFSFFFSTPQDNIFRMEDSHFENGRGKSPYDPKLLTASLLVGRCHKKSSTRCAFTVKPLYTSVRPWFCKTLLFSRARWFCRYFYCSVYRLASLMVTPEQLRAKWEQE